MSRNGRKAGAVALLAMLCALASPAHAWHFGAAPNPAGGPDERGPGQNYGRPDDARQRRAERQQLRDELRSRQREGLSPAGAFDPDNDGHGRRMSPEERRRFRRDIDDAGRQVYGPRGR